MEARERLHARGHVHGASDKVILHPLARACSAPSSRCPGFRLTGSKVKSSEYLERMNYPAASCGYRRPSCERFPFRHPGIF